MKNNQRPHNLLEMSFKINNKEEIFNIAFDDFLDHFATLKTSNDKESCLLIEPLKISNDVKDYQWWWDAYIAGAAEYLSVINNIKPPNWVNEKDKFLRRAYFANSGLSSLNAILYVESPTPFRRRFIFTEKNPLRRV